MAESKKNDTNKLMFKTENKFTDLENTLTVAEGKGVGRDKLGA